jgi:hypothetical protein
MTSETICKIRKSARAVKNLLWLIAILIVLADIVLIFAK